ncbi:hypothetical protein PInf_024532 [Phytophthora infestans]|nr:hypothetical protein PInf_024532 [Phytophthora infestans]
MSSSSAATIKLPHSKLQDSSSNGTISLKPRPPLASYTFGGLSAVGAVFFTHPFDLLKIHLQTEGTYSTMRFAVYHYLKDEAVRRNDGQPISTGHNVLLGMTGGIIGGAFGNPADIVNIRMQADSRLPPEKRRNYKHAVDGLLRVEKEEGLVALMRGSTILDNKVVPMRDNLQTHVLASMVAGLVATTACAPADVVKTRLMNMHHNEYKSATDCFVKVVKHEGLRGLYKGWLPAYMRLGPQTLLTFVFLEQLRKRLL